MNKNKNKKEMKKLETIQSFFLLEKVQKEKLEGFYKNFYQPLPHSFFHEWSSKKISLKIAFFRFLNKFIQYATIPEKKRELLKKKQKKYLLAQKKSSLPKQVFFDSFFDFYTKPWVSYMKPLEKNLAKKPVQKVQKKKTTSDSRFFQENFFFAAIRPKIPTTSFGEIQPTSEALLRYGFSYKIETEKDLSSFLGMNLRFHWIRGNDMGGASQYVLDLLLFFLKKRIPYRRVCSILFRELRGLDYIEGIRITYAGRLGGKTNKAVRSKKETKKIGKPSLHIFSAKIDFAQGEVQTKFGMVGIKIWIRYK